MLKGGNPLTVGVGIIIEVIRKNNSDYDPEIGSGVESIPSSRDPIYLGTLLRLFASHVPDFMKLILSHGAPVTGADGKTREYRRELKVAFGGTVEPLGFDRFKTCELMAELLHCSNMGLLNEKGGERYVKERDAERERLKAECYQLGLDGGDHDVSGSVEEVVVEKAPLQVQNGGIELSDDGMNEEEFEDVTISGVLDDPRTEGDEAMSGSLVLTEEDEDMKKSEDDIFADEPLSEMTALQSAAAEVAESLVKADASPGKVQEDIILDTLETKEDKKIETPGEESSKEAEPVAEKADVHMEDAPPVAPPKDATPEVTAQKSATDSGSTPRAPSPPPLGGEEDAALRQSGRSMVDELKLAASVPAPLSPKPPPVSAERLDAELPPLPKEPIEPKEAEEASLIAVPAEDEDEEENLMDLSGSSPDSTMNEGEVSVRSLGSFGSSFTEYQTLVEPDLDGNPVVGDYLKMMFVEHQVVPTILVCIYGC